jgi:undecaprenyl-phosphate galactose phosphotransferase
LLIPDLKGMSLLKINSNLKSPLNRFAKRIFDAIVSVLILPFLLIIIGIIGILIKLESGGPVLFVQERLKKDKTLFRVYKIRTMYENADETLEEYLREKPQAVEEWNTFKKLRGHDPRVTKIGKFLRATSLDELPQIFNVIRGEMSLVGPRPYLPREESDMKEYIDIILLTLPGITGLWQVSGRNELNFNDRLKLDAWYVQNWSLRLDIVLILKTVYVVITRKGAS